MNLLIVDDEKRILTALKRLLRRKPYTCFFAGSGQEALSIIADNEIHVIVSDLDMPKMSGIELLQAVRKTDPDIVRLILSGRSESDTVIDAINNGNILRYITKPWNEEEFIGVLNQAFDYFSLKREKKELVEKLQEYNLDLEKKVSQKTKELVKIRQVAEIGKHASQIVHNLNNPLNAINGALQLIGMMVTDPVPDLEKIQKYIQVSQNGSRELGQIISSILINARDMDSLGTESIDLDQVIQNCLTLFDLDSFFRKELTKDIDLCNDLPRIKGNRIQLKQIFDNLIKNALDAMEQTKEKRLSIRSRWEKKSIRIDISDTGSGIQPGELDKIFSPDFTTKPVGKGTGLGLASVKTMVESYHGTIRVESEHQKGTTFRIQLPAT